MEYFKERLVELLNDEYCRCEDQMAERDMTKDEWLEQEKVMRDVAKAAGLTEYYPYKDPEADYSI